MLSRSKVLSKFFLSLFFVSLPSLALICFTEYKLRQVPYTYNFKRAEFEKRLDSIEVLFLGSSHGLYGFDPDEYDCPAFNLANHSQSLFYDCLLAEKYIGALPQLRTIVIPVAYFSFFSQLHQTSESWRDYYYYQFWNIRYPEISRFDKKLYSMILLVTPGEAWKWLFRNFDVDFSENLTPLGFFARDTSSWRSMVNDANGTERVRVHDQIFDTSQARYNFSLLDELLTNAEKEKIDILLINMPVYHFYSDHVDPGRLEMTYDLVSALQVKHDFLFLDMFRDTGFLASDFYNTDHLNAKGAKKLAAKLNPLVCNR